MNGTEAAHRENIPLQVFLFLTRPCPRCALFAGWEEASARCAVGVSGRPARRRRQNQGNGPSQDLIERTELEQ